MVEREKQVAALIDSSPAEASGAGRSARPVHRRYYVAGGVLTLLACWQLLSLVAHEVIVASPLATLQALWRLALSGVLWTELLVTIRRLVIALSLGTVVGLGLGLLAGLRPSVRAFFEPARWVATTLPAAVIAVLGMLWFGLGDRQVIFLVFVIITPILYVNTMEGILAIDQRILEMARVYKLSRGLLLREVYLPGIGTSVMAGLTLAAGIGIRAVILAEVLGAMEGVGHSFSRAWTFLNTPEMFAWIMVALSLMAVLELGLLQPVRRRLLRWREGVTR
jgi:NitT/TauT family transport system permease protein